MGMLDYKAIPWGQMSMKPAASNKFTAPKTDADIAQGRNNAQDSSKFPTGTTFGVMPGVGYVSNQRRGLQR